MTITTVDLHFLGLEHAIASYIIENSEGPILIETGPYSTYPYLVEQINALGYKISDFKHVFITHIHLDHAGAAWAFAKEGANIYLHPLGVKHMADPSRLMASAKMIYKDDMDRLWGQMEPIPESQLIQVGDKETIKVGDVEIKSLHTPGHAKHHIAWQIDGVIFSGDVAGVKIANGPVQPPCPPPDINIEYWLASINILRKAKPSLLYLTHYGSISNVDGHFDELEEILSDWSDFVKVKWEGGMTNEAIVPLFINYTNDQLKAKGLSQNEIDQYQAANPSWMSVAGLVRYWTKKMNTN
ncbi:MBL fold metallo-hydrolase [Reichenbachiella versicolor]|uniref:MBL fold metallo-hydrolase n=1 Tax=Reichenbachiella versicolor TaxID=1821036 RepID=UPI000D6E9419|nr:MBL fold metallo-hydrolase [Reichenbachiella versicolor]